MLSKITIRVEITDKKDALVSIDSTESSEIDISNIKYPIKNSEKYNIYHALIRTFNFKSLTPNPRFYS